MGQSLPPGWGSRRAGVPQAQRCFFLSLIFIFSRSGTQGLDFTHLLLRGAEDRTQGRTRARRALQRRAPPRPQRSLCDYPRISLLADTSQPGSAFRGHLASSGAPVVGVTGGWGVGTAGIQCVEVGVLQGQDTPAHPAGILWPSVNRASTESLGWTQIARRGLASVLLTVKSSGCTGVQGPVLGHLGMGLHMPSACQKGRGGMAGRAISGRARGPGPGWWGGDMMPRVA